MPRDDGLSDYRPRSIKHTRRTKVQLAAILEATRAVIAEEGQLTIRHLFYRLVGITLLEKTEKEYKHLVSYLSAWRRSGLIPWSAFADNIRRYYADRIYDDLGDMLTSSRDLYRRDLWASQNKLVEIWVEKDAMANILADAVNPFGVSVFPVHGFSSLTAIYSAAESFKQHVAAGREVHVYYFGDHDPSGLSIERNIINSLKADHGVEIDFQRVAVLPKHILKYDLPTRPPKKTDSRAKSFHGEAVDVDAMPLQVIRELAENCVVQHIDPYQWQREKEIEAQERATLDVFVQAYGEGMV